MKIELQGIAVHGEQAERDQVVQLSGVDTVVPAHDWILYDGAGNAIAHCSNRALRQLYIPADDDAEVALDASIPAYVPGPNTPPEA